MSLHRTVARVLATTLVLAGAAVPGVARAADPPPLTFRAATDHVYADRFVDGDIPVWFDLNLGLHMIAGQQPFEIRAKRSTYADPIVATLNGAPLPAGLVTSFSGFEDFTTITVRDASGAVRHDDSTTWCPNSLAAVRSRPDAPSRNPYPFDCGFQGFGNGGNPFLLGGVWGVQAGYATPVPAVETDMWTGLPAVDCPAGTIRSRSR